ncbi:MAG: InlB B-repeat-containing protein [Clostridia bacterium]|nr:InlB B-repeat-containing protein [Clostridia bacterium]
MNYGKTNQKLFKTVLLLLSLMLATVWLSTGVVAGSGDPTLTLKFDSQICTVTIQIGDAAAEAMVSEKAYEIPYSSKVTVTVTPNAGYKMADIVDTATGLSIKYADEDTLCGYYAQDFLQSVSGEISFTPKDYKVDFEADGVLYDYAPVEGVWSDYTDLYYHYKDAENLTKLPEVSQEGYNFGGWEWISSDGATYGLIPTATDENGARYYYIPSDLIPTGDMESTGKIYVHAVMIPKEYPVIREDRIYDGGVSDHRGGLIYSDSSYKTSYTFQIPKDTLMNALTPMGDETDDALTSYIGYELVTDWTDGKYENITVTVPSDDYVNIVYRLYKAINYTLQYELGGGTLPEGYATSYSYRTLTPIANPTRTGYTFDGWTVTVIQNGEKVSYDDVGTDFVLGNKSREENEKYASEDKIVILKANWTANEYKITYDWNVTDETLAEELGTLNQTLPAFFTYDAEDPIDQCVINNPVRHGYTFSHWVLTYVDEAGETKTRDCYSTDGKFVLNCNEYAQAIKLTANWTAKKYTVKLDGNGATKEGTATLTGVEFDKQLVLPVTPAFVCPEKTGFTFAGYWSTKEGAGEQYITDKGVACEKLWDLYEDTDGVITLYARWTRNSYNVTVNIGGISDELIGQTVVELVTSDGEHYVYNGQAIKLPYETKFTVTVTAPDGYKTVKWNDFELTPDMAEYTSDTLTMGAEDMQLSVNILKIVDFDPSMVVIDYFKETITLPNGSYLITLGETQLKVFVSTGEVEVVQVNGQTVDALTIPEEFFGSDSVKIVRYGNGTTNSDSNVLTVAFAARPAAPKFIMGDEGEIRVIKNSYDTQIIVEMKEGLESLYEYAISAEADISALGEDAWSDSPVFADLKPGTWYYVFIRVKATEEAPHGTAYCAAYSTMIKSYLPTQIQKLQDMLNEDDGDITKALIQNAIDTITVWAKDETNLPDTFYNDVEALIKETEAALEFTRLQDQYIILLQNYLTQCINSGSYTTANAEKLNTLCSGAVTAISAATTPDEVNSVYTAAMDAMKVVPVTYLYDENFLILLTSKLGLSQGSVLDLSAFNDFAVLANAVDAAIRSGQVAVNGNFMRVSEAEALLRELDMVSAYSMDLSTAAKSGDSFVFRLKMTDEMKSMTGLQVAYYDAASGIVELLKTTVDEANGELVFEADRIADFVILADPTIELTPVIYTMGTILLLQLIAIVAILISRARNKKTSVHACMVLPAAFLTVHFLPANAEQIVAVMGILIVLFQIILMYLLLSSDMIYRGKRKQEKKKKQKQKEETPTAEADVYATPAMTEPDATAVPVEVDDDFVEMGTEEHYATDADEADPFAVYDDTDSEDVPTDVEDSYGETYAYGEAAYGDAESNGSNAEDDFIEPAANPNYSLPDEDGAFAIYDESYDSAETADEIAYVDDVTEGYALDSDAVYGEADDAEYVDETYDEGDESYYEGGEDVTYEEAYVPAYEEDYGQAPVEELYEDSENAPESEEDVQEEIPYEVAPQESDEDGDSLYRYDE